MQDQNLAPAIRMVCVLSSKQFGTVLTFPYAHDPKLLLKTELECF